MAGYSIFHGTMADMTMPQVEAAVRRGAVVIVPTAVIEMHGQHQPLATDVYASVLLARLAKAEAAKHGVEVLIAPPFYWGINRVTSAFPATFLTRPEIAAGLLHDIIDTLVYNGFQHVALLNHHGDYDHNCMLRDVVNEHQAKGNRGVRWLEGPDVLARLGATGTEETYISYENPPELAQLKTTGVLGVHAHEHETAFLVRYYPEVVDYDQLAALEPTDYEYEDLLEWRKGGETARRMTPLGHFGHPRPVDPDLWRWYDLHGKAMGRALARHVLAVSGTATEGA